jgi:A/G-specific adenine glycosylase
MISKSRPAGTSVSRFRRNLLAWFDRHKRDLPWRQDRDPYRVWISEIMLQQTRVAAVVDYYNRFIKRFPTVEKLAAAREASVLAVWSGLGYYRRARMLHAAAKEIVSLRESHWPTTAQGWQELPGIGRYTAAAIASIAFDEPRAVVDGNVERVLSRVSGRALIGEARWELANQLLSRKRPGDFNQAMMELGATVCLPRQPACLLCPVSAMCETRGELPNGKTGYRQHKKEICYAFHSRAGAIFLLQRPPTATLMPGLWELPEISRSEHDDEVWLTVRHSITVTDYKVHVIKVPAPATAQGQWIAKSRLTTLPLTGLARKILRAAQVI